MRFAIAIFACVLAVANAQFGQYNNFGQYQPNQYQNGKYQGGQFNRYQNYNRFNNQAYKPFVASTPFPPRPAPVRATASVSVTPAPFVPAPPAPVAKVPVPAPVVAAKVAADARSAEVLKIGNEINPDGSFNYFFETNNGIAAQAQGTPRDFGGNPPVVPDVIQGSFSWYSPEGEPISVTYIADENGYQPQSAALPVPPPVPDQIARALAYVAQKRNI